MNRSSFTIKLLLYTWLPFFSGVLNAQVCSGSLGDPVVNITFGDGAPGPSSYVPTASYTYTTSYCPNDGYYSILKSTSGCYGGSWHTLSGDHTGKGNFMLVNASLEPGDFFLTTVSDLCPNTTYEFSAWICNVMNQQNSIEPDIVFSIEKPDGTFLGTYDTGPIPVTSSPQWVKYGILFTTPADNSTIVLRMVNNAHGGLGNDLALDDIAFRPCGEKVSAAIQNNPDTVNLCEGQPVPTYQFYGDASAAYLSPVFQWQTSIDEGKTWQDIAGATGSSYSSQPSSAVGEYLYRFTVTDQAFVGVTSCRIASNVLNITIHPNPVADAGPDRTYIKNFPVTLNGTATGEDVTYTWSPPSYIDNVASLTPVVTPPVDITYTLTVQSAYNCKASDYVKVNVAGGIYVPNAFSPNGDAINDYWQIPYLDVGFNADVKVFNRWGFVVYHVKAATVSWDGKLNGFPQPAGTYVYQVIFENNTFPPLRGTLTLIR